MMGVNLELLHLIHILYSFFKLGFSQVEDIAPVVCELHASKTQGYHYASVVGSEVAR